MIDTLPIDICTNIHLVYKTPTMSPHIDTVIPYCTPYLIPRLGHKVVHAFPYGLPALAQDPEMQISMHITFSYISIDTTIYPQIGRNLSPIIVSKHRISKGEIRV